jgi:2-polyprenyl-3-methyl-5-hydroxy-6-metoxy-1,4-benzoquinol methylase
LSATGEQRLKTALIEHFISYFPADYLASEEGARDLAAQLFGRLSNNRDRVIPWIVSATGGLKGSRILEIGCGTGATTVALAEQGALVTAVDPEKLAIAVARERIDAYGLSADISCISAADALRDHKGERFDLIAFLAVLEHMTLMNV